jgi:hypothetical protein
MAKSRGGDGNWIEPPSVTDKPIIEVPLGDVGMEALAPTMLVMTNLPAITSLASSLVTFLLETEQVDRLHQWMIDAACESHAEQMPDAATIPKILLAYKQVIDNYLLTLGMTNDFCTGEHGEH